MTDAAWAEGIADLVATLPDSSPTDEDVREHRSRVYRRHLDHLSDTAWLFAVSEAIRHERWFPSAAALRDYGERFRAQRTELTQFVANGFPGVHPALPPAADDRQREIGRVEAKRGVELCRAAYQQATRREAPTVASFPRVELTVELTEERREELKRSLLEGGV